MADVLDRALVVMFGAVVVIAICLAACGSCQDDRLLGGESATIDEVPYQLAFFNQEDYCGAAAIGRIWAITSKSCFHGPLDNMLLRAGTANLTSDEGSKHQVTLGITHSGFSSPFDYDVVLLMVAVPFPDAVVPLVLPSQGEAVPENAWLSGYGDINDTNVVGLLHKLEVSMWDKENCSHVHNTTMTDRMVCFGLVDGPNGGCENDFGGPLVFKGKLCGILLSVGNACEKPRYPGVYTSVSTISNWIRTNIGLS